MFRMANTQRLDRHGPGVDPRLREVSGGKQLEDKASGVEYSL